MHSQLLSHCETLDFIARDLLPSICLKMQIVTVDEPHNVVLLHCWSILFHTVYDISFKSWHLGLHDVSNEHMRICRISQSTKDMLQEILMILTLFCFKFIRVCTSNYFHIKRFDKSYSSSSSTQGQRGRSVHSPRGPILSAVEGVSSGQATVWTDLVQPGDRRTAPWSVPVWEGWNSISDVACHAQNCFGRYIIWHMCNVAELILLVPKISRSDTNTLCIEQFENNHANCI